MTEAEWLAASNPDPMAYWEPLKGKASERKHRLYICGLCRVSHAQLEPPVHRALDVAERYSDGLTGWEELDATEEQAGQWRRPSESAASLVVCALHPHARKASASATYSVKADQVVIHAQLLKDLFGNPFRPVTSDPSWLTSTVVSLAAGIYAERAFDRLPILADALQDAGCDDAEVLSHCRVPNEHVRGCWVVDLLLGKT